MDMNEQNIEQIVKQVLSQMSGTAARKAPAANSDIPKTARVAMLTKLEHYDITGAGYDIEAFTDELSNWYVRRNRERFWAQDLTDEEIKEYADLVKSYEDCMRHPKDNSLYTYLVAVEKLTEFVKKMKDRC